jgi:hypothetical protein
VVSLFSVSACFSLAMASCPTSGWSGRPSKRSRQTLEIAHDTAFSAESLQFAAMNLATDVRTVADDWESWSISDLDVLGVAIERLGLLADRYLELHAARAAIESSPAPRDAGPITDRSVTSEVLSSPSGSSGFHLSFCGPLLIHELDSGLSHPLPSPRPGYVWDLHWLRDMPRDRVRSSADPMPAGSQFLAEPIAVVSTPFAAVSTAEVLQNLICSVRSFQQNRTVLPN